MLICSKCGYHEEDNDSEFCQKCGEKFVIIKTLPENWDGKEQIDFHAENRYHKLKPKKISNTLKYFLISLNLFLFVGIILSWDFTTLAGVLLILFFPTILISLYLLIPSNNELDVTPEEHGDTTDEYEKNKEKNKSSMVNNFFP